jgi:hypothetical protein
MAGSFRSKGVAVKGLEQALATCLLGPRETIARMEQRLTNEELQRIIDEAPVGSTIRVSKDSLPRPDTHVAAHHRQVYLGDRTVTGVVVEPPTGR